ncbi:hypothetical protein D4764_04G0006140 [Takifugu flavidus]|uniref:Uncharacterized protein n=1 Tax=Takifugu flavidus TaxID=433684 RepID=A0A5C6N8H0_9TELE|nr:hypothetical protein D4764_04G0006140 [Takifugu flavidus]
MFGHSVCYCSKCNHEATVRLFWNSPLQCHTGAGTQAGGRKLANTPLCCGSSGAVQSLNSLNDQLAQFMVTSPCSLTDEDEVFVPGERDTLRKSMTLMRHLLVDAQQDAPHLPSCFIRRCLQDGILQAGTGRGYTLQHLATWLQMAKSNSRVVSG